MVCSNNQSTLFMLWIAFATCIILPFNLLAQAKSNSKLIKKGQYSVYQLQDSIFHKTDTGFTIEDCNECLNNTINVNNDMSCTSVIILIAKTIGYDLHKKGTTFLLTIPVVTLRIVTSTGDYLKNANITVNGNQKSYSSDQEGIVTLKVRHFPQTVKISYAGMQPQIQKLAHSGSLLIQMDVSTSSKEATAYSKHTHITTAAGDGVKLAGEQFNHQLSGPLPMALVAKIPGLQIIPINGIAGSSVLMLLRGIQSIMNVHAPLFVIDGVPFPTFDFSISNIPSGNSAGSLNPLSLLALGDIDTVEVLKGPVATAIYGARGAGGVILITTNQGKPGRPSLTMDISSGFSLPDRKLQLMSNSNYYAARRSALANDGYIPNASNAPDLTVLDTTRNYDWAKHFYEHLASSVNFHIRASKNTQYNRYAESFGWNYEESVLLDRPVHQSFSNTGAFIHKSSNGKWNTTLSYLFDLDWNHQFTFDLTRFQFMVRDAPKTTNNAGQIVFYNNYLPIDNPDAYTLDMYKALSYNALGSIISTYSISKSLTLGITIGANNIKTREFSHIPLNSLDTAQGPVTASSYYAVTAAKSFVIKPTLEYKLHFGGHKLFAQLAVPIDQQNNSIETLTGSGYINDSNLNRLDLAPSLQQTHFSNAIQHQSAFARLTDTLLEKIILTLAATEDGCKISPNPFRYGFFGAAGTSWIFSREKFFKPLEHILNFGQLNLSYGTTGNQLTGNNNYFPGKMPILLQSMPAYYNPILQGHDKPWETIKKEEATLYLALLKNLFSISITYFRSVSENQLLPRDFPIKGTAIVLESEKAAIENKGWELSLSSGKINFSKFSWSASINLTLPSNRLLSYPTPPAPIYDFSKKLVIGQSLNVVKAYRYLGVNPNTGLSQFKGMDPNGNLNTSVQSIVGKTDITCFGGITNTFNYGPLQLDVLGQWETGRNIDYHASIFASNPPGSIKGGLYSNMPADVTGYWEKPGDKARFQKLTTSQNSPAAKTLAYLINSDYMLKNTSFFRLQNVQLNYHIDSVKHKKCQIDIYIQAQNLFLITSYKGVDPETNSAETLNPLRTFLAGCKIHF